MQICEDVLMGQLNHEPFFSLRLFLIHDSQASTAERIDKKFRLGIRSVFPRATGGQGKLC